MKRVASLLPKPFGELTVGVGIGLADVMQALFTEPRQFGSLPDPEPPEPEKLAPGRTQLHAAAAAPASAATPDNMSVLGERSRA